MDDDILNMRLSDITKMFTESGEEGKSSNIDTLSGINKYERTYLLKPDESGKPSYHMDNDAKAELYDGIFFNGMQRFYVEKLSGRDYNLEGSSPYKIKLFDEEIIDNSWGIFVCKVVKALLKVKPEYKGCLFAFRVSWTSTEIFSSTEKTNYKWIDDNIYMNCNQTSLHLCWLLQEVLDFFDYDRSNLTMLIHRPVTSEPNDVREHIDSLFVMGFKSYICRKYCASEDAAGKVIHNIRKVLNPILAKNTRYDDNFFLFDDMQRLLRSIKKVQDYISDRLIYTDKEKRILNKCLKYLKDYYQA